MGLLTDVIRNNIQKKHREEELRKENLREMYTKVAFDPDPALDDAHREEARANLAKLLNPEARKSFLSKAVPLFDHVRSIGAKKGELPTPDTKTDGTQPQQEAPQSFEQGSPVLRLGQGLPTPQAAAAPVAAASQLPTPATAVKRGKDFFDVPSIGTNAERVTGAELARSQSTRLKLRDFDEWYEKGKKVLGADADPRDLAEWAATQGQRLPARAVQGSRKAESWKLADGTTVDVDFDPKSGTRYVGGEAWDIPDGASRKGKDVNMQLAWAKYPGDKEGAPPHAIRIDPRDPTKRLDANTGQPVPSGAEQIDTALLQAKIRQNAYGQFGNLYRALVGQGHSESEANNIAGQQVEAEYQKRLSLMGAGSIREAIGQDAEGNAITVPLVTTRTPSAVAPVPAPGGAAVQQAAPSGSMVPATVPASPAATVTPTGPQSRMLPGVSPATAKNAAQFGVPITESVVQIFGDENQPGLKSFAKLADDENASKRIGKAIQLTLNGFGEGIGEASLGGGAGGVHVSSGGFGTWLQNALGLPGKIASDQAQMIRSAMKEMTPQEREAYDATMAEMSVMAGLRSLSKAPAAMASIRNIEREIPKIGINVANSAQMYDQLEKVAGAINNAVSTPGLFPRVRDPKTGEQVPVGISTEMLERIKSMPAEMRRLKGGGGRNALPVPGDLPKPKTRGAKISLDDAKIYLQAANGDTTKARLNANLDGWTF